MTLIPQLSNFLFSPRHRRGLAVLVSGEFFRDVRLARVSGRFADHCETAAMGQWEP